MVRVARLLAGNRAASRGGQAGQGLAEYALILALIALAAIVALMMLGADILGTLSYIGATIQKSRP